MKRLKWILAATFFAGLAASPAMASLFDDMYSGNVKVAQQAFSALKQAHCKTVPGDKSCTVHRVRVIGNWAWFVWSESEAGGSAVAKWNGSSWQIVMSGGGVLNAQNAVSKGVPKAVAEILVPVSCPLVDETAYLTTNDLSYCSAWDLLVSRNMIYAKYGRTFTYQPLRDYFLSWPSYHPNPNFSDNMLSDIERANAKVMFDYEKSKGYL